MTRFHQITFIGIITISIATFAYASTSSENDNGNRSIDTHYRPYTTTVMNDDGDTFDEESTEADSDTPEILLALRANDDVRMLVEDDKGLTEQNTAKVTNVFSIAFGQN